MKLPDSFTECRPPSYKRLAVNNPVLGVALVVPRLGAHVDYWHSISMNPDSAVSPVHGEIAATVFRGFKESIEIIGASSRTGQVPPDQLKQAQLLMLGLLGLSVLMRKEGFMRTEGPPPSEDAKTIFDLETRGHPHIYALPDEGEASLPSEGQWYRDTDLYVHQEPIDPENNPENLNTSFTVISPYVVFRPNR